MCLHLSGLRTPSQWRRSLFSALRSRTQQISLFSWSLQLSTHRSHQVKFGQTPAPWRTALACFISPFPPISLVSFQSWFSQLIVDSFQICLDSALHTLISRCFFSALLSRHNGYPCIFHSFQFPANRSGRPGFFFILAHSSLRPISMFWSSPLHPLFRRFQVLKPPKC